MHTQIRDPIKSRNLRMITDESFQSATAANARAARLERCPVDERIPEVHAAQFVIIAHQQCARAVDMRFRIELRIKGRVGDERDDDGLIAGGKHKAADHADGQYAAFEVTS